MRSRVGAACLPLAFVCSLVPGGAVADDASPWALPCSVRGQADRCPAWVRLHSAQENRVHDDVATSVATARGHDGVARAFVTGSTTPTADPSLRSIETVSYDEHGALLWRAAEPIRFDARATKVVATARTVFVGGCDGIHLTVVAYEAATGKRIWYGRYPSSWSCALSIAVSPDEERVFAAGYLAASSDEAIVVAFDAGTGARLWVSKETGFPGAPTSYYDVATGGDSVFVTGHVNDGSTREADLILAALDASTGARRWTVVRDDGFRDAGTGIDSTNDGSVVAFSGYSGRAGSGPAYINEDFLVGAIDGRDGAPLWTNRSHGASGGFNVADDVEIDEPRGRVVASGMHTGNAIDTERLMSVRAHGLLDGSLLWSSSTGAPGPTALNRGYAVAVGDDGDVFVAGRAQGAGCPDAAVAAFDGDDGAQRWIGRVKGGKATPVSCDEAYSVAVFPGGQRVVAAGYVQGVWAVNDPHDYLTVAFDVS